MSAAFDAALAAALAAARPLPGDDTRLAVPEHATKDLLAACGVRTPARVTAATAESLADAVDAAGLVGPLAVKGFGATLVHKSDAGAVVLGVRGRDAVVEAATGIGSRVSARGGGSRVSAHGGGVEGFLAEEMAPAGSEVLVGVVERAPFGAVVAVGLGGTLTEILDDVALRLWPVGDDDVDALLDGFRASALLRGARGKAPADRAALAALVASIAGPDGAVARLRRALGAHGLAFAELECNPVIAGPDGAVAVDARLVVREAVAPTRPMRPTADFTALFNPRSIAVAGASTSKESFGNRFLAAYRARGWQDGLYAIHPTATEVDGVPAHPSADAIPGGVDYVVAAVPASATAALVAQAATARFVHVISGGFAETGHAGAALEAQVLDAADAAGVRVVGPNCMGVFSPTGRQAWQLEVPTTAGRVSVISQSGGLAGDIIVGGDVRGVRFAKLVTVGNCIDVTPGELLEWMATDPETGVVGLYLEDPRDGDRLVAALRRLAGRVPVVALVGGLSRQGGRAVASHTGSLAGDRRIWDAIGAATGLSVVATLEHLLGALAYVQRYGDRPKPDGAPSVLVVGAGGGASVLGADACDRAGLDVVPVDAALQDALRAMGYGAGTSVANPIEIPFGPVSAPDAVNRVLDPILAGQRYTDVIVHVNVQAFFSMSREGGVRLQKVMEALAAGADAGPRLSIVLRNLETAPPVDGDEAWRACIAAGMPVYRDLDEAAVAVAAMQRFDRFR
jgi:acyl-CoA synthetase (NDP forming)